LRVLYVIDGLGTGGAERSLAESLPGLERHGIEMVVRGLHPREVGVQQELASRFDVGIVPGATRLQRLTALHRVIAQVRPDLVHTTLYEADVLGRLANRGGAPLLTTLANTNYAAVRRDDPAVSPRKLSAMRRIDAWTARHLTTHFHAVTHAVKRAAMHSLRVKGDAITVIERGRDMTRLGERTPARRREVRGCLGLAEDDELLLTVGRQEHQKGQIHLLDAMAELVPRREKLVLVCAGRQGAVSGKLEQLRRQHRLSERVQFLGHRDDVPDLLAAADLFVFPSLYEGIGGAAIEAMALGLPIVSTRIPAMQEVLADGTSAVLVPPADPAALAVAIEALLDDPARRATLGDGARRAFAERFAIDRYTARIAGLYSSIAADRSPSG
jgi:glycosyltransferase involved in cell wall biosynthesis